ncbi:MAG: DUF4007 family protein [Halobacteriovoraceae bacterium]|nr:DUF4007 family protein [Halobacteriovoraceae bacterium]
MKLEVTNGYLFRFEQASRILSYCGERQNAKLIPRQGIIGYLGISDSNFKYISSMLVAFGLLKKQTFVLTSLGRHIAEQDLFFEKKETLWLMHYTISADPRWVVWHRIFHSVVPIHKNVSAAIVLPYLKDLNGYFSEKTIQQKLPKEINAVLRNYVETKLSQLDLLRRNEDESIVKGEAVDIPPLVFLYALIDHISVNREGATSITRQELMKEDNALLRIFYLQPFQVDELLNQIHQSNLARLETFGDLDQLRFASGVTKEKVLDAIYH